MPRTDRAYASPPLSFHQSSGGGTRVCRLRRRFGALAAATAVVGGLLVGPIVPNIGGPVDDWTTALGLRTGTGACAGNLESIEPSVDGLPVCVHGIDTPAEVSTVDAASEPAVAGAEPADFPLLPSLPADIVAPPGIPCFSASSTSPVVKVFYLYPKGSSNRLKERDPQLREAVAIADLIYAKSAARTGGVRHVRWKMTTGCQLAITAVAIDRRLSLSGTRNLLVSRGLLDTNEKGLAFREDGPLCYGMGQLAGDSRPSASNQSNRGGTMAWLMVSPCLAYHPDAMDLAFGYLTIGEMAAHELGHTLGAVQYNAPHSSHAGHCTDESDVMCYQDTPWTRLRHVCAPTVPELLDCRNDDYFSTSPRSGTYLASHWNIAQNRFLARTSTSRYAPLPRPSISLDLAAGATIDVGTPVGVTISAASDGRDVAAVALLVDGRIVDAAREPPFAVPFETPYLGPPLTTGQNVTLTAVAYDALGRQAVSAPIGVVVGLVDGNPGPGGSSAVDVAIVSPATGSSVNGPFDVRLSVGATGTTVVRVEVAVNGVAVGTATAPDWSVRVDPAALGAEAGAVLEIAAEAVGADDSRATDWSSVLYQP